METALIPAAARGDGRTPRRPARWITALVRAAAAEHALLVAGQAPLAGQFINGTTRRWLGIRMETGVLSLPRRPWQSRWVVAR